MRTWDFPYRLKIGDVVYVVTDNGEAMLTGKVNGLEWNTIEVAGKWQHKDNVTPNPYMAELFMWYQRHKSMSDVSAMYDKSSVMYKKLKHLEKLMYNLIEIELHLGMRDDPENKFMNTENK